MILYLLVFVFFLCILYTLFTSQRNVKRYTDQGIVYMGSFTGNLLRTVLKGEAVSENVVYRYNLVKKANQKFGVELEFGNPSYFVTDLELIKQIVIKHFDHFTNSRKIATSKRNDDLIGRMLISLEGPEWRALRSKMSPTFTTGKIKRMFHIMNSSAKKLVIYLKKETEKENNSLNMQDAFSKFTMDFISSAAFGLDTKSFENATPSRFEQMATEIQFRLSIRLILKFSALLVFPKFSDFIGLSIFDVKAQEFFHNVINTTIKAREENRKDKRDDFLELMLEARDGQLKAEDDELEKDAGAVKLSLEDADIAAQSLIFIAGGYDTVRSALQFAAYNLALNPEVQERLFQELNQAVEDNNGELSYEMINDLKYLDQVISESLRILPIGPVAMRSCSKDYGVPDSSVVISKGSIIVIPIYAIHHDPEYFPNPELFDPERFSPENRPKLYPNAYMPFGQGPRNCIAMRLALVELKSTVAHLVLNFVLEPSEKTHIPMRFSKSINLQPDGGVWLKLQSRK